MASIFTKIINGDLPAYKVAETEDFIAFLDINPNSVGHTLCVPKLEVDKIFDLDEEVYSDLMLFSRKVALGIRKTIECQRVGLSIIGLEVPHAHVHLIPLQTMEDARFTSKTVLTSKEFEDLAKAIASNIYF